MNDNAKEFIIATEQVYGKEAILTRAEIQKIVDEKNVSYPYWLVTKANYRVERGSYKLPTLNMMENEIMQNDSILPELPPLSPLIVQEQHSHPVTKTTIHTESLVPKKHIGYVPFGFYKDLESILSKPFFFPVFISGWSGNGKTLMVEQACSKLARDLIRVNISIETDQTDLLGGPTLVNGNVVNRDGPVIEAMRRGAILLLDEIDRGSNKLLCLQSIMEGKPYFNKHTGELVYPKEGFNIIATANTKGKGSDEGRYLAQILDDAFLERFAITIEQESPQAKTELKILQNEMKNLNLDDEEFTKMLVDWAIGIRKTYEDGGVDEIVTTRRLVFICRAYGMFNDRLKAITYCINRFDDNVKKPFLDLYTMIDDKLVKEKKAAEEALKKEEVRIEREAKLKAEGKAVSIEIDADLKKQLQSGKLSATTSKKGGATVDLSDLLDPNKWKPIS